jgi:hypothetical protein
MNVKKVWLTHPVVQVQCVEMEENRSSSLHIVRNPSNFHIGTCGYIDVDSHSIMCLFKSKRCLLSYNSLLHVLIIGHGNADYFICI